MSELVIAPCTCAQFLKFVCVCVCVFLVMGDIVFCFFKKEGIKYLFLFWLY